MSDKPIEYARVCCGNNNCMAIIFEQALVSGISTLDVVSSQKGELKMHAHVYEKHRGAPVVFIIEIKKQGEKIWNDGGIINFSPKNNN